MTKKIALIYTGGTFGCIGEPLSPMPHESFIPKLKRILPNQQQIDCFTSKNILDSSAATAKDWLQLIQQIQELQLAGYENFVIIHGTDTLSYAAAVLSRFLQSSCRVILTGSQYPLLNIEGNDTREFTDAIDNLNSALDQVVKVTNGVYLAFYHQVFHASTVLKVHTTALDAFRGQKHDHDLEQNQQPPHFNEPLLIKNEHFQRAEQLNILNWMMLPISKEKFADNLKQLLVSPPDFLVIQAYGTGNLNVDDEIIEIFKQLKQRSCQTILTTQVPLGGMDQRYSVSQWIKNAEILTNDCASLADLYAKILKIYLQYPTSQQWHDHWFDSAE
ncbi:asparaginase domain-containing protein [Acinetobacter gerneri]|uniref:asparaginase domain-containing protein n=1 Tax=Acinetobacter gerneri TaxID=202952 RepID=UPI0029363D4A|nr:asparaginase domain-containing protein [Acinetobacter gerneri]MDV2440921.1 asparaginase domain-containing protein [Acinetobacter gerneri]